MQNRKYKEVDSSRAFKLSYQHISTISDTSALFAEHRRKNKTSGFVLYGAD